MMVRESRSNFELVNLSETLHQLADRLRTDRNESRFLVHETLMTAFATPSDRRPAGDRGLALRRWMVARSRAGRAAAPTTGARDQE
jgi:hypothetical protein